MAKEEGIVAERLCLEVFLLVRQNPEHGQDVFVFDRDELHELTQSRRGEGLRLAQIWHDHILIHDRGELVDHPLLQLIDVVPPRDRKSHDIRAVPFFVKLEQTFSNARLTECLGIAAVEPVH